MNNFDKNPEKCLTIEDLLKIKRHEKPDAIFWEKFDNQLREKTLEKLVYRPSIITRISNLFTVSLRPALSVGALAILTIIAQPIFYSRTAAIVVEKNPSAHQTGLIDFASVKRNYIKNNIVVESGDDCNYANAHISPVSSSKGVRYLAGNLASVNFGNAIVSNTVY